jgi:glycine betaine/proline transport system substrate-binding protein
VSRLRRWVPVVVIASLVLAACGSTKKQPVSSGSVTTASPGVTAALPAPGSGGTITLAINPWDGSAANANVAKVILEKQLGMTVKLVDIDENAVWAGLDSGQIDANLEVWPSGHASDIQTYITGKKSVINAGLLGPTGKIGWFIPKYVADAHPEYATYQGLNSATAAKYFATAETGSKGQFLLGDPSYVSYDDQIIKNLNLPFKVVVGGGEAALITALGTAFKDKSPLLFYFYQPQWANAKYALVAVKLPAITPQCTASAAGQGKDGKYNCDYPTDPLLKAVSAKLQTKNPKAFQFLSNMNWTGDDQNLVTSYKNADGLSMAAAAQKWVDANQTKWKAWVPS